MEPNNTPSNNEQRRRHRRRPKKSRGHGCLGFGITLSIVVIALICVLMFTTNVLNGPKYKILSMIYQKHYTAEVEAAAKEFDMDENLIYAVIRTESGFDENAESHAGAVGLMQLMPDTFSWLQEHKDGQVIYTDEALRIPEINIRYGTYYLSYLKDLYGDIPTAVAAYNAGASAVDSWLSDPTYSDDGKTLKKIPYDETEKYVKKVTHAWDRYQKIYNR